jgi:hypothetical protein
LRCNAATRKKKKEGDGVAVVTFFAVLERSATKKTKEEGDVAVAFFVVLCYNATK